MKTKIYITLILLALSASFQSCKKNDDNSPSNSSGSGNNNVSTVLTAGSWRVSYFHENSSDHTNDFNGYTFTFNGNGTMTAANSSGTVNGTWRKDDSSNEIHFSIGSSLPLTDLNKGWIVTSQSAVEIIMMDDNSSHNEELRFAKI